MRALTCVSLATLFPAAALFPTTAFCQPAETPRAFEAADVRSSPKATNQPNPNIRGPFLGDGRYEVRMATMVDLISKAYGVDPDKVFGGPTWIEYDRFDVRAKVPANTSSAAGKLMLQALLAERFKLVAKTEDRPMPAYTLKAGADKPKLKPTEGAGNGCMLSLEGMPNPATAATASQPMLVNTCRNMTTEAFVQFLRNGIGSQSLNNTPVVDQTGLEGAWDFSFKYTLPPRVLLTGLPAGSGTTVTLFDAIDKQLGMKLELTKLPLPVIVVESVNQTPTPNAAGIEKLVPPTPTEFEVADVKPVDPDFKGLMLNFQPGRVTIAGPVRFLIQQSFSMRDDMVFGWEKWMDNDRYNIVGKVPASVSPAQGAGPADQDTIYAMLRALLIERFNMKVHYEERPLTAYTLVAAKPKLKKADPSERTKWVEGPGPDGKDPRDASPILGRLVTVTNMTMAQLADRLQGIAPGYISSPVIDGTGLEGGYDFTLSFSPNGFQNVGAGGGRGGPDAAPLTPGVASAPASEPNGGITLFEAMEKQLGLKLEAHKRPVQVLVIDHVEQKPIDN